MDKKKQKKVARKTLRQIKNADMKKADVNVARGTISLFSRAFEICGNFFRNLGDALKSYGNNMVETAKNIEKLREEDVIGRI